MQLKINRIVSATCLTILWTNFAGYTRERKPNISGKTQVDFSQRTEKLSSDTVNFSRIVDLVRIFTYIFMSIKHLH